MRLFIFKHKIYEKAYKKPKKYMKIKERQLKSVGIHGNQRKSIENR